MTVDLIHYNDHLRTAFGGLYEFHQWMWEQYEPARPFLRCKRCGEGVWGLVQHARNVHGDDLPDLPPNPKHVAEGRLSDEQGRLVIR